MYKIGEYVVYGTAGVCQVEDITTLNMRDVPKEKQYYVLTPLNIRANHIFAPVEHTKVPMRKIITRDEAEQLIERLPELEEIVIENPKFAESILKETLKSCDVNEFARVIKTLYNNNKKRLAQGKKITASGEKYLRIAEDGLYAELALVLEIDRKEVPRYIEDRLKCLV
jgi:CarD family transcriptional regulator